MSLLHKDVFKDKKKPVFSGAKFASPEELLAEMNRKMHYGHEPGKAYHTPSEIREHGIATCWGAADFEFTELTHMGYDPCIIFLSAGTPPKHTHTATVFERHGKWFWIEWAWGKHDGINGPYHSLADVKDQIIAMFVTAYGQPSTVTVHKAKIGSKGISDSDFLKKAGVK